MDLFTILIYYKLTKVSRRSDTIIAPIVLMT